MHFDIETAPREAHDAAPKAGSGLRSTARPKRGRPCRTQRDRRCGCSKKRRIRRVFVLQILQCCCASPCTQGKVHRNIMGKNKNMHASANHYRTIAFPGRFHRLRYCRTASLKNR